MPRRGHDDDDRPRDPRGPRRPLGRALSRPREGAVHDEVALRLRAQEQRYTAGRRAIVSVLERADRPLTVPEIMKRSRPGAVPVSSAYRNLAALVDAGAVHRVAGT